MTKRVLMCIKEDDKFAQGVVRTVARLVTTGFVLGLWVGMFIMWALK